MRLKRHINFINEYYHDDSMDDMIKKAEERILTLEKNEWKKVNGRWNVSGDISIGYDLAKDIIYKGDFLISFGVIDGTFICQQNKLTNKALKNLPTLVKGDLDISHNHITNLEYFNTEVMHSINLSHNHLHELKNMPNKVNGTFDISSNMITSLEGCPEEVNRFKAADIWINTLVNAPKRVIKWHNGSYNKESGADVSLDEKIPKIEQKFYRQRSYLDKEDSGTGHYGITNYWTELYQFILEKYKDNEEGRNIAISSVKWPNDVKGDLLKKSVTAVSKFDL